MSVVKTCLADDRPDLSHVNRCFIQCLGQDISGHVGLICRGENSMLTHINNHLQKEHVRRGGAAFLLLF